MTRVRAIFHRIKTSSIYPLGGDRFLIEAILRDDVHDVHVEVEVVHPSLEIVAARSEVRNGPFTNVCDLTHPNMQNLVGMKIGRGFTLEARKAVGGVGGCHRVSELVVEIAQAGYQLHFVRYFSSLPKEVREAPDVPIKRWRNVNNTIPGMRNTCFTYSDEREDQIEATAEPIRMREQNPPEREIADVAADANDPYHN
ncbi:MAG: hypothetical protein ACI8TX_000023 [Hyphomicrobiaceae bacterium]|jgi:hypothetical protein